ncbi:unnamed protein product [Ilex paraguariensis]|uniref:Uncharacterized protein n=1 Tax=Ilex paraguariensis TaxID=185542 RepID=A0ABC8QZG4_9AQUA
MEINLLDGVANAGMVELDDVHLAAHLVEKKSTGQPFFRNGKYFLCRSLHCAPKSCKFFFLGKKPIQSGYS